MISKKIMRAPQLSIVYFRAFFRGNFDEGFCKCVFRDPDTKLGLFNYFPVSGFCTIKTVVLGPYKAPCPQPHSFLKQDVQHPSALRCIIGCPLNF